MEAAPAVARPPAMGELRSKRLIVCKGILFLVVLVTATALLLAPHRDVRTAALLAVVI